MPFCSQRVLPSAVHGMKGRNVLVSSHDAVLSEACELPAPRTRNASLAISSTSRSLNSPCCRRSILTSSVRQSSFSSSVLNIGRRSGKQLPSSSLAKERVILVIRRCPGFWGVLLGLAVCQRPRTVSVSVRGSGRGRRGLHGHAAGRAKAEAA